MQKWEHAENYMGTSYYDYYVLAGHHRNSGILEESNFQCIVRDIKKRAKESSKSWIISRSAHWMTGWVEDILIHQSNKKLVAWGNKVEQMLEEYPVYDEDDVSHREDEYAQELWKQLGIEERKEILTRAKLPLTLAQQKYYPQDAGEYLTEDAM